MPYHVIWPRAITNRLARIHLRTRLTDESEAVIRALAVIEEALERRPAAVGESREEGVRVLIESPLTIYYEIHEEARVALVVSLRYNAR